MTRVVKAGKGVRRKRHNRHGFINFGGRHTGQKGSVEPNDIVALQWIARRISTFGSCTVDNFDAAFVPTGRVIRYGLRNHNLAREFTLPSHDTRYLGLTPKGAAILKRGEEEGQDE
jgi:hypothetical protein